MSKKKILSVGFELASKDVEECNFDSNTSLLDWDIVMFRPEISQYLEYAAQFQGKFSLPDSSSFRLKERSEHWRREIRDAYQGGKTVVIYLPNLLQVYVDSGNRTYSGTGRNRQTTRLVDSYDNYKCIPAPLAPVSSSGNSMKLSGKGADLLASYWKEFGDSSQYEVILTGDGIPAALVTKGGERPVGALYRSKSSNGALILLPNIDFYPDEFLSDDKEQTWTNEAHQFAARLVAAIVALDKSLKSVGELTPEPNWARSLEFELDSERELRGQLLILEQQFETLQRSKEALLDQMNQRGRLRYLLYEKGKPLEAAIIEALHVLGFSAHPFKESDSEFDVVFESPEGRLIGEAEGKDTKAINIDKLRQLAMNIHEDLQRESVTVPAKGVLFGNAYRLLPIPERQTPFTEKCITATQISSTALIATVDLFRVARFLSDVNDPSYANACRQAIILGVGIVSFPPVPELEAKCEQDHTSDEL